MLRHRAWMLLVLGAVLFAVPAVANAQDCWDCESDPDEDGPYGVLHHDGRGWFPVSPPDGQHLDWGTDYCTDAHVFMCAPDDEDALELLAEALEVNDLDGAATAFSRLGSMASLNADRTAVQVGSCLDANVIIAHFPMVALNLDSLSVAVEALAAESESKPSERR